MGKKPDSVVYNEKTQIYDAFLKEYAVSVSGPRIEVPDLSPFKKSAVTKANHRFTKKAEEIKSQMESLFKEFSDNEMVWSSEMSFEPYSGCEIFVYKRDNGSVFTSILSPEQWGNKFESLGNFRLDSDSIWKRI